MSQIKQTAIGSHNSQVTNVFVRPYDTVEICASTITKILEKVAHIDFLKPQASRLRPPDIAEKNEINDIDAANAIQIEQTYALWDEINESIQIDANGNTANKYNIAAFVLNQLYLAKYQRDFPRFKIHAIEVYCQSAAAGIDEAHVLTHLIHHMYLSCRIGIAP